jgi:hypothetical protein
MMLCSIYFSLYQVPNLLTPFSPLEIATTLTTLLIRNKNSLVAYVWDLYIYE